MDLILYFVFNIPKKQQKQSQPLKTGISKLIQVINEMNPSSEMKDFKHDSFLFSEFYFRVWRLNLQEIREREQKLKLS